MSVACPVDAGAREAIPAAVHFDGTARPQTVSRSQEPWIHRLLRAVRRATGYGVVINTSFNTKGKPIVNTAKEALQMLREDEDLDAVIVEDYLFTKRGVLGKASPVTSTVAVDGGGAVEAEAPRRASRASVLGEVSTRGPAKKRNGLVKGPLRNGRFKSSRPSGSAEPGGVPGEI